ncbi:hypothetical protein [Streptomyces sp. NBC_01353]|uniref:hypothetical protein n=1 Tax=Streptomyces sp. NBC_01353 TaxID=2903835 RepID=UPI002E319FB0|nr:hypothetical protein [Streptomyces sp. NBC_01353]
MSVMTPARIAQPLAHYDGLYPFQQNVFDNCMEHADDARDAQAFNRAMTLAALAIAIDLPASGSIVKCACAECDCAAIFDPAAPGLRRVEQSGEYNLPRLQCAHCADEHPAPSED